MMFCLRIWLISPREKSKVDQLNGEDELGIASLKSVGMSVCHVKITCHVVHHYGGNL